MSFATFFNQVRVLKNLVQKKDSMGADFAWGVHIFLCSQKQSFSFMLNSHTACADQI